MVFGSADPPIEIDSSVAPAAAKVAVDDWDPCVFQVYSMSEPFAALLTVKLRLA